MARFHWQLNKAAQYEKNEMRRACSNLSVIMYFLECSETYRKFEITICHSRLTSNEAKWKCNLNFLFKWNKSQKRKRMHTFAFFKINEILPRFDEQLSHLSSIAAMASSWLSSRPFEFRSIPLLMLRSFPRNQAIICTKEEILK